MTLTADPEAPSESETRGLRRPITSWRPRRGRGLALLIFGVLVWLVAGPIALLANMSVHTGSPSRPGQLTMHNYDAVYGSAQTWSALTNTALYAVLVSVVSLVIATAFAWFVERTDMPGRGVAWFVMLIPLAMPGILASMSWILMLAPNTGVFNLMFRQILSIFGITVTEGPINIYSLPGMVFVEGFRGANTLFLMLVGAFRLMDPTLEDAAMSSGATRFEALRRVTMPLMVPALMAAGIFAFLGNLADFDTPLLIGLPAGIFLLPTLIYFTAYVSPSPSWGLASAYATIFLLVMVVLVVWYYRVVIRRSSRFVTVTGKGYRPRRIPLGKWRFVAFASVLVYALIAVVVPVLILLWASLLPSYEPPSFDALGRLSFANYVEVLQDHQVVRAALNTVVLAVTVATLTMLLAFVVSWVVVRVRVKGGQLLDGLAFAPNAIPSVAIAMGFAVMYLYPGIRKLPVYGTVTILIIALVTTFLAFATRISNGAMTQLSTELEEASWASGAGVGQTFRRIVFPILLPTFAAGWVWVAAHAFRNLTVPLLLARPDNEVLAMRLYFLWVRDADFSAAAAIGICMIVLLGVLAFLSRRLVARGFVGD